MIAKKIIDIVPLTNNDAEKHLKDIEKTFTANEKEIPFEVQQTKDYLSRINSSNKKDTLKELLALEIPEATAIELINNTSSNDEVIKAVLYKKIEFEDSLIKKIKEILN